MGRSKKIPGLINRSGVWHINKLVKGRRICESTSTSNLEEANQYLGYRLEALRQADIYGMRPRRTFREAATKYLLENQHKKSLHDDALHIKQLDKFIGELTLDTIHLGTLQPFINSRKHDGVKNRTINYGLQVVRQILNKAAGEWMDERGLTWLAAAPKIKLLPQKDARPPHPLSWEDQAVLFEALAPHLREMALFAVNTGCRSREICNLRWDWEIWLNHPEVLSVFVVPGEHTKNGLERVVILNRIAREVIERQRGVHSEFVFTYKGQRVKQMMNSGWKKARKRSGIMYARVHDIKHTFGARLRAAGVSREDRQDLLGHKSKKITTHYSAAELHNLWLAANKACDPLPQTSILLQRGAANIKQNLMQQTLDSRKIQARVL